MQTAISSLVASYAFRHVAAGSVTVKVGAVINREEVKTPFFIGETWVTNALIREFRRACGGSPVSVFLSLPRGDNVYLGEEPKLECIEHAYLPIRAEALLKRMVMQWGQNAVQGVCETFRVAQDVGFDRGVPFGGILRLLKADHESLEWLRGKIAPKEFWKSLEIREVVPSSENFNAGEEGQPASIRDHFTAWRATRWLVSEQVRAGLLPKNMVGRLPRLREGFVATMREEERAKIECQHHHELEVWRVVTGPCAIPDWMKRGFRAVAVEDMAGFRVTAAPA